MIKLGNRLLKYGLLTGVGLAGVGFLFYEFIGQVFIKDQAVLDRFYEVFWIILIMQPLCSITFIFDGMFKEWGLQHSYVIYCSLHLRCFIPSLLLFDELNLKLYGVWYTFILWIAARGFPWFSNSDAPSYHWSKNHNFHSVFTLSNEKISCTLQHEQNSNYEAV